MSQPIVYLIPTVLTEEAFEPLPAYLLPAIQQCTAFYVENERTARRYLKKMWKEMVIDDHKWVTIHKAETEVVNGFINDLKKYPVIGILSEAGCPGIADPGQVLIAAAQHAGATIKPLVGPSSILLALMASGMNGQKFTFNGYLPIDSLQRQKTLKELEADSKKSSCTHLFIETPYRNNTMLEAILKSCQPATRICIAADITSPEEYIRTKTVTEWKKKLPDLHKRPVIFLLDAS